MKTKKHSVKYTYGISCGKTSVTIFIESVLALEVGAAARRIFKRAIMYCKENLCKVSNKKKLQITYLLNTTI